jgi:pimeloyl-ACP methyl ester carboxylesterase
MVLSPGSPAGQGGFAHIAPEITKRTPGLAVWTVDRRPNAFEDVSVFKRDKPNESLSYYLLGDVAAGKTFQPVADSDAGFVREWGAALAINDLRNVVEEAGDGGRRCVILGGHSFGTLLTEAYLAWDFDGTPGYQGLSGIVLIDGGLLGAFDSVLPQAGYPEFENVEQAQARIAALQDESPFGSDGSIAGLPAWVPGVIPEVVCQYALKNPNGVSTIEELMGSSLIADFGGTLTNEAFAGLFFQATAGDEGARTGRLESKGSPRGWHDGRFTSLSRFCSTFTAEPGNGLEWYFPQRLMIDLAQGMQPIERNAITEYLGLRPFHLADIDLPLYVIQTKLSDGGVLDAAHRFIDESKITDYKLVNDRNALHVDPLVDYPSQNKFLKTVVPFIEDLMP